MLTKIRLFWFFARQATFQE